MADQWNDNIPSLSNAIADDIPDIEENFGWIQRLLKMLIGYQTSTIANVSPPGEQRSKFAGASDTVITIGPGRYFHDGTTRQMTFWDADISFTVGSGGSNSGSEDLGASEWHYLYIDDSAVVTQDDPELDDDCFINNTTAPTWSDAKHGWYNGSDRCIFAFYSDADSDIEYFLHDGGDFVEYQDSNEDRAAAALSTSWTDVTLFAPGFATQTQTHYRGVYVDADGAQLLWRTNGQAGTSAHSVGYVGTAGAYSDASERTHTDSSQKIEVRFTGAGTNQCVVSTSGWYFPIGM